VKSTLTRTLVFANIAVFVWMELTGAYNSDPSLINHGALRSSEFLINGEWWRLFTAAFVHGGITHIALNMIALWQVGSIVETLFGARRMALLYVIAIVGSGLAVVYFSPDYATVGASGAIFGLFGAMVSAGLRLGTRGRSLVMQTVPIIVINLIFTFSIPGISAAAHVGGLISGFLAGFILFLAPLQRVREAEAVPIEGGGVYEPPEVVHAAPPPSEPHPHP
jgi:rhomboid protease GluP